MRGEIEMSAYKAPRFRALVVDDEPGMRELIVQALEGTGIDCYPAHDGLEALVLLTNVTFDLVVSDLRMPRMDGLELFKTVTECGLHSAERFLVITGMLDRRQHLAWLLGAGAYLMFKPFHLRDLDHAVKTLLSEEPTPRRRVVNG